MVFQIFTWVNASEPILEMNIFVPFSAKLKSIDCVFYVKGISYEIILL